MGIISEATSQGNEYLRMITGFVINSVLGMKAFAVDDSGSTCHIWQLR